MKTFTEPEADEVKEYVTLDESGEETSYAIGYKDGRVFWVAVD